LIPPPWGEGNRGEAEEELFVYFDELAEGPVVRALRFGRERAGGQLLHLQVVLDTLAASALPAAPLVGAAAEGEVRVQIGAFHHGLLLSSIGRPLPAVLHRPGRACIV